MNTPTPLTDEAWSSAFNAEDFSASSVARSMRVFSQKIEIELAAANEACRVASEDALLMRDDLYKQLAAATTERDQLRAEVERLRSDRDCEKRLRKDAEELREDAIERSMKAEAALTAERDQLRVEVERLGHLEAVLRSCAFDKDGTAWKTVCGWWSKKYDAVERQMSENATRAERAEAEVAKERARLDSGQILLTVAGERVWHSGVDLRAAIDAAMKEGAK